MYGMVLLQHAMNEHRLAMIKFQAAACRDALCERLIAHCRLRSWCAKKADMD